MNQDSVDFLVGLILPPLIDTINQNIQDSRIRFWVSMLVSVITAGVVEMFRDGFTLDDLLGTMARVFTTAQIVYHTYWKRSDARRMWLSQ